MNACICFSLISTLIISYLVTVSALNEDAFFSCSLTHRGVEHVFGNGEEYRMQIGNLDEATFKCSDGEIEAMHCSKNGYSMPYNTITRIDENQIYLCFSDSGPNRDFEDIKIESVIACVNSENELVGVGSLYRTNKEAPLMGQYFGYEVECHESSSTYMVNGVQHSVRTLKQIPRKCIYYGPNTGTTHGQIIEMGRPQQLPGFPKHITTKFGCKIPNGGAEIFTQ